MDDVNCIKEKLQNDPDEKSIVKLFKKLDKLEITLEILCKTKIGKVVNSFRKHDGRVGDMAKFLVTRWKEMVPQNVMSSNPNNTGSPGSIIRTETVSETNLDVDKAPKIDVMKKISPEKTREKDSDHKKDKKRERENRKRNHSQSVSFDDQLNYDNSKPHKSKKKKKSKDKDREHTHTHTPKPCIVPEVPKVPEVVPEIKMPSPKPEKIDISSTLPEISPSYKPLRRPFEDEKRKAAVHIDTSHIGKRVYASRKVYAGKRTRYLTKVPKLFDSCLQVLKDNVQYIENVGAIPASLLMPILEACTPEKLYELEDFNHQFLGETDDLWKKFCKVDFKNSTPSEFESWRELYLRLKDEQEEKLARITDRISQRNKNKGDPKRKTKLAFENSIAKPPRSVLRKQIKNGVTTPHALQVIKPGARPFVSKPKKIVPPLMQKTLKLLRNVRR
ncbi:DgyrCDS4883 [Dimorphilus gyrociliatus]|uniref:DgyrCDS4883 n=1 Tax=Dimorphilus gyrociliatus TaxID=2664684 RepID=A0A7I8VI27_9ANNE|nr:DgyrCDS4883 [Dimorphilus gyrociliatus]